MTISPVGALSAKLRQQAAKWREEASREWDAMRAGNYEDGKADALDWAADELVAALAAQQAAITAIRQEMQQELDRLDAIAAGDSQYDRGMRCSTDHMRMWLAALDALQGEPDPHA